MGAYVLGTLSFRGEMRRRITNSPSNTPFMQAMRTLYRLPTENLTTNLAGDASLDFAATPPSASTWGTSEFSGPPHLAETQQAAFGRPIQDRSSYQSFEMETPSLESPKPIGLSYEELRARNRGQIK